MRVTIRHETRYTFSGAVFLEPHLIRLTPRHDGAQSLEQYSLRITPRPAGQSDILDACGNRATRIWFTETCRELSIEQTCRVQTHRTNPFDYLLDPTTLRLPFSYGGPEQSVLQPYLAENVKSQTHSLAIRLLKENEHDTVRFLNALTAWIYGNIHITTRLEPGVRTAEETLRLRTGACRDVTVLFMDACRAAGLPARYVSGYAPADPDTEHELHAWPEVYLPGAGWRGYDPTLGLTVADGHIALCSAPTPELTAPVDGTFRGNGMSSTLTHHIAVEISD